MDNFYSVYVGGNHGGGGVTSLNSLNGALTLVAGPGITITPAGSNITISSTGVGMPLTQNHIFVGNGSNAAMDVPMTGDVNIAFSGGNGVTSLVATSNATLTTLSALSLPASQISGTLAVAHGGTGDATLTANNLLVGAGTSAVTFIAPGSNGNILTSNGTTWSSSAPATSGTVTSVAMSVPAFLSVSGSPITSSGTLAVTLSGTALPIANGGTNSTTALNNNRVMISSSGAIVENAALVQNQIMFPDANGLPSGTALLAWNAPGLDVFSTTTTGGPVGFASQNNANAIWGGLFLVRQSRGTKSSPTATQTGDHLGEFSGAGYGATAYATTTTGKFMYLATENWSDTAWGTKARIFTTPNTTIVPVVAVEIGQDQSLSLFNADGTFIKHKTPASSANYTLIWPAAQSVSTTFLQNDGSGNLSWTAASFALPSPLTATISTAAIPSIGAAGTFSFIGDISLSDQTNLSMVYGSTDTDIHAASGDTNSTSNVTLMTGTQQGSGSLGNAGNITIAGGSIASGTGSPGNVTIRAGSAGNASVNGGNISITSGPGASSTTGNITLKTKHAGDTSGKIQFQNSSEGTTGSVWSSIDTSGTGTWSTAMLLRTDNSVQFQATNTTAGTTGNQTINKISGTVNFAAAASTLTVTNSLVTTSSIVFAVVRTNDTTATIKNVVPGSGSFVITLTAGATAETSVGFFVINQ